MKCEKCQDIGFIELDKAGLLTQFCDCEIGRQVEANKRAIYGIPEEDEPESLSDVAAEANAVANALMPRLEGELNGNGGAGSDNTDTGSGNTSQPEQPIKPKKKKKARKRTK